MKKRLLSFLLALCMVLTLLPGTAWAATVASGTCGDNLTWKLTDDGTLTISGTGPMFDYGWYVSENLNEYLDTPWFDQRDEITEIIINDGVTGIGANAFAACWKVSSVSIPDSVMDIGKGAFDGCPAFEEAVPMSIEAGVMPLASTTENVRYAVLVLDVSGSMTSVAMAAQKASAIKFCTELLNADGENYVAVVTFSTSSQIVNQFSSDLDELTKSINGIYASGNTNTVAGLQNADDLLSQVPSSAGRSIVLCSDGLPNQGGSNSTGPFTSSDSSYYYSYANAVYDKYIELVQKYDVFTLGFFHSLYGTDLEFARKFMESIQNAGYYEVTDPDDLEFTFGDIAGDVTTPGHSGIILVNVPKDQYVIHVVSDAGRNLSGVTVTCNGTPAQTNNYGLAYFDRTLFVSTPRITATRTGYIEWSNEHSNWSFDSRGYATIKMYPTSAGKYKLSECLYSDSSDMSSAKDLLTRTKTVTMYNELWGNDFPIANGLNEAMNSGKFYLSCKAIDDSEVTQYEIWQGSKRIETSTDGKFNLQMDKSGAPFVEGGKCFIRVITSGGDQVDTNINLQFEKATVNSNDFDFSFNGGNKNNTGKLSFKLGDDIPFVGGGTFSFQVPGSVPVYFDVSPDGKKFQIGLNLKKDWSTDKDNDKKEKKTSIEQFKELVTDARTAGDLNVGLKKNLSKKQLEAFTKLQQDYNKFSFLKDGSIDFLGYLERDFSADTFKGHAMLKVTVNAPKFGFTAWVIVVPVTANVKLELGAQAIGELGYDWANAQWIGFLDVGAFGTLSAFGGIGVGKAIGAGAYGSATLEGDFRLIGSPWGLKSVDLTGELGLKAYVGPFEYEKPFAYDTWNLYTRNNVRTILLNEDSEPVAISLYDADNYKLHDLSYLSEESEWMGTPIMLLDASAATQLSSLVSDTYRDAQPVIVSTNDALYAAFLKADESSGDVYVAVTKFDGGTWSKPVRVDNNAVMDGMPSLCVDNSGNIWLAYAQTPSGYNKNSTLLDYAKGQKIIVGSIDPDNLSFTQAKEYSGTGYAHLQQIALSNGNPTLVWADSTVTDNNSVFWPSTSDLYSATYENGSWGEAQLLTQADKPVLQIVVGGSDVAYVADADGNYTTTEDQNLYLMDGTTVAENVQGKVTYGTLPGMTAGFIWNAEDCLKTSAGNAEIPAVGITSEYALAGSRIYYSSAGEEGAHLTTIIYDSGNWSNPVTLTGGERYLENLSAVRWNGDDYVMGMNTLATITENDVDDAKDLVWGKVVPTHDLRFDGIDYDADGLTAGASVPVTLTVTNAGDQPVSSVDVSVNNGAINPYPCSIAPGASADITVNVTCPSVLTPYTFRVSENGQDDYTPDNNTGSVYIGYADLDVTTEEERIEGQSSLVVYLTNKGVASATGAITVTDSSGKAITTRNFENVGPGDTFVVSIPVSSGVYTASAALANGEDDLYTYNNADTITVGEFEWIGNGNSGGGGGSAPSNPSYQITVPTTSNGTVSITPTSAKSGDKVTITATPDSGYKVGSVTVRDAGGNAVAVTSLGNNQYSFTMPSSKVIVDVTFVAAMNTTTNPFVDIQSGSYYYDAVLWAYENGVTTGIGDGTTFSPDNGCTRAQFVTFLWRAAKSPEPTSTANKFSDVSAIAHADYYKAILWAAEQGITTGSGDGTTFSPDEVVTRAQSVTFMHRYAKLANIATRTGAGSFDDVTNEGAMASYYDAIGWAVANGITNGNSTTANTFGPMDKCSRAMMVTFLYRLFTDATV